MRHLHATKHLSVKPAIESEFIVISQIYRSKKWFKFVFVHSSHRIISIEKRKGKRGSIKEKLNRLSTYLHIKVSEHSSRYIYMKRPGFVPGSPAWKSNILTIRPKGCPSGLREILDFLRPIKRRQWVTNSLYYTHPPFNLLSRGNPIRVTAPM